MADLEQASEQGHHHQQAVDPALRATHWEAELVRHNASYVQQNEGPVPQHQYASPPPPAIHNLPNHLPQGIPQQAPQRPHASRLKKACDHCSERKVKCDNERPCKACLNLGIPCTENRQSKRRGPPNRTLQRIQAQQADGLPIDGNGSSSPDTAAHVLTTRADQTSPGIGVLGDLQIVTNLLDDYFSYLHPLAPIPHEPTFRATYSSRADLHDPSFVALVASMVGALTTSYPQRARMHFSKMNNGGQSFKAYEYAVHCRSTALRALTPEYLEKSSFSTYDIMINFLLGHNHMHEGKVPNSSHLYFSQCQALILSSRLSPPSDNLDEEQRRRTVWALFSKVKDMEHVNYAPRSLSTSINALVRTIEYPLPNDDEYLTASGPMTIPHGYTSRHIVFDTTIRMYNIASHLANPGETFLSNTSPWSYTKKQYQQAMAQVDLLLAHVPSTLTSDAASNERGIDIPENSQYGYKTQCPPGQYPLPNENNAGPDLVSREALLREVSNVPKATLCANALQVKSSLVEKYHLGLRLHKAHSNLPIDQQLSPDEPTSNQPVSDQDDLEQVSQEKDNVVRHVLNALMDIAQRDSTDSLNLEFVVKMKHNIHRLLYLPPHAIDDDGDGLHYIDEHRGPLVVRSFHYLEAVASTLNNLEKHLSVSGDHNGVERDVQHCWSEIKALGNEFGVGQMIEG